VRRLISEHRQARRTRSVHSLSSRGMPTLKIAQAAAPPNTDVKAFMPRWHRRVRTTMPAALHGWRTSHWPDDALRCFVLLRDTLEQF
jgi:hypothetical protein